MYSNKDNVNILTSLLVAYGVKHAVVCPGSRNAPIVHNLNECPDVSCHPVTDERSAGFYALGMAQALDQPVVVCCTSGTALLNLLPAVAEAFYQHQPLIVVSADRPQAWIGQLDGQTLPQPGSLGPFVAQCVSLPEPKTDEERWYCNRLVNEALLCSVADDSRPVHINVPISEPLFTFSVARLPIERRIEKLMPAADYDGLGQTLLDSLQKARRPMIVIGQTKRSDLGDEDLSYLFSHVIVLHEQLAPFPSVSHFDEVLARCADDETLLPDFVLYVGDVIVSKRLRHFLRRATSATVWRVARSGNIEDTFMHLHGLIVGDPELVLHSLSQKMARVTFAAKDYRRRWLLELKKASVRAEAFDPDFSQAAAVRQFEALVPAGAVVHYANSTAVRLANIFARHYCYCNRGVNGIEGSLSTAAGFSVVTAGMVFCVIGDLSFFYDQNALWNQSLRGNFRILLLNNGRGGIFNHLPGLEESPARDRLVAAAHTATAEGICHQNNVTYLKASGMAQLQQGLERLFAPESDRPVLLEAFTAASE